MDRKDMDRKEMSPRIRGVSSVVQQTAKRLREEMTPAETRLWEELSARKLNGLRFRAQHPIGQFILDFYCPACKLVIELDGVSHTGEMEQDAARTAQLAAYGYRVLRFQNDEVMTDLAVVLQKYNPLPRKREKAPKALKESGAPAYPAKTPSLGCWRRVRARGGKETRPVRSLPAPQT